MQIPAKLEQDDKSQTVVGLNPCAGQDLFHRNICFTLVLLFLHDNMRVLIVSD